ncbi:MAG: SAM-dependent DNA methyltransferase [Sedimentisphaerales bacterium]|nr:SAM-dependent DNA methyltransferase [Sedimentisphaerales bacterium]
MASSGRNISTSNGLNRRIALHLLDRYAMEAIEGGIVQAYLKSRGIHVSRNKLILSLIEKCPPKTAIEISLYLKENEVKLDLGHIEKIFEILISPAERKVNGAYYTPNFLVDYIIHTIIRGNVKICDPACGSGAFLVAATKKLARLTHQPISHILAKNIFGCDILESSVRRCKLILSLLAVENACDQPNMQINIECADALSLDWRFRYPAVFKSGGFDAVVGNPPYVRTKNLPEDVRERIHAKWTSARSGNVDLFIPFVELGISLINEQGLVGYVLPNGFTNSFAARDLRRFLQTGTYVKELIDFNHLQLFNDATTYVAVGLFNKSSKETFDYALIHSLKATKDLALAKRERITFTSLEPEGWKLLPHKDLINVRRIESAGPPLGEIADIKTGIATLRNDLYVISDVVENGLFFLKVHNGKEYRIEKTITKPCIHAGTAKTTEQVDSDPRRIIFPYHQINGNYDIVPEKSLRQDYPECYRYLLSIRHELEERDKGNKHYETWYAYGRTQGLDPVSNRKIVVPTISNSPRFVITNKYEALIYAGYGIYFKGDLDVLAKVLNSKVMWYYISRTSKRYSSGYMSLAKNFIKNFSVPEFEPDELIYIKEAKPNDREAFLMEKYGVFVCL